MKKSTFIAALMAVSLSAIPYPSFAQPLKGRLSLGYTDTTGNTEEEKVNFNFKLRDEKRENFLLRYEGLVNYGKASGEVNSDKKQLGVVGEFVKDSRNSWYVQSGVLKDRFAGYETRLNFGAGYYKTLIAEEKVNLKAAAGIEITREDFTDSTSETRQWLKFGLLGDKMLAENIKLISSIDYGAPKSNFEDRYEIDFSIGTLFTVNTKFDFETRYVANYRRTPLVAGKEKTDSTFSSSLVYKM